MFDALCFRPSLCRELPSWKWIIIVCQPLPVPPILYLHSLSLLAIRGYGAKLDTWTALTSCPILRLSSNSLDSDVPWEYSHQRAKYNSDCSSNKCCTQRAGTSRLSRGDGGGGWSGCWWGGKACYVFYVTFKVICCETVHYRGQIEELSFSGLYSCRIWTLIASPNAFLSALKQD